MTLYYSLVFALLVAEMVVFGALIVPMPFTWRRKLFIFLSENKFIAKIQYGLKITFIFILILFVDSVNRVYRVYLEKSQASRDGQVAETVGGPVRAEINARKFYSERNMYLTGFTIFLSLILNRTYSLILEQLRLEEEVKRLTGDPKAAAKTAKGLNEAGDVGEISGLKKAIAKKDKEIEVLKSQGEGFQREYNRLSDEKIGVQSDVAKKDK